MSIGGRSWRRMRISRNVAALDLVHDPALELHEPRVRKIKRNRNSRCRRREPFLRQPEVRPEADALRCELGGARTLVSSREFASVRRRSQKRRSSSSSSLNASTPVRGPTVCARGPPNTAASARWHAINGPCLWSGSPADAATRTATRAGRGSRDGTRDRGAAERHPRGRLRSRHRAPDRSRSASPVDDRSKPTTPSARVGVRERLQHVGLDGLLRRPLGQRPGRSDLLDLALERSSVHNSATAQRFDATDTPAPRSAPTIIAA